MLAFGCRSIMHDEHYWSALQRASRLTECRERGREGEIGGKREREGERERERARERERERETQAFTEQLNFVSLNDCRVKLPPHMYKLGKFTGYPVFLSSSNHYKGNGGCIRKPCIRIQWA